MVHINSGSRTLEEIGLCMIYLAGQTDQARFTEDKKIKRMFAKVVDTKIEKLYKLQLSSFLLLLLICKIFNKKITYSKNIIKLKEVCIK